jgi:hypothetical protein
MGWGILAQRLATWDPGKTAKRIIRRRRHACIGQSWMLHFLIFLIQSGLFAFAHPLLRSRRGNRGRGEKEEKIFFLSGKSKMRKFSSEVSRVNPRLRGSSQFGQ